MNLTSAPRFLRANRSLLPVFAKTLGEPVLNLIAEPDQEPERFASALAAWRGLRPKRWLGIKRGESWTRDFSPDTLHYVQGPAEELDTRSLLAVLNGQGALVVCSSNRRGIGLPIEIPRIDKRRYDLPALVDYFFGNCDASLRTQLLGGRFHGDIAQMVWVAQCLRKGSRLNCRELLSLPLDGLCEHLLELEIPGSQVNKMIDLFGFSAVQNSWQKACMRHLIELSNGNLKTAAVASGQPVSTFFSRWQRLNGNRSSA